MKILAFILSILVATALVMGGLVVLIFSAPHPADGLVIAGSFALSLFVYGPLTLGSLTTYWDMKRSPESRRYYARWWWITVALEILAAIALIIFAIGSAPIWLAPLFIAVGAILTVIAPVIGRALLRYERKRRPDADALENWTPITRDQIARKVRAVAITFVVTFVIAIIAIAILGHFVGKALDTFGTEATFAAEFAFIAGALACIIVTFPLNRQVRESTTRDIGVVRKIGRVVLRGKTADLSSDEEIAAAKYAVVISITLPFTLAYVAMLYIGIGIGQVRSLSSDHPSGISLFVIWLYVALLVVLVPLYIVRIRRARRYAREHADLLLAAPLT